MTTEIQIDLFNAKSMRSWSIVCFVAGLLSTMLLGCLIFRYPEYREVIGRLEYDKKLHFDVKAPMSSRYKVSILIRSDIRDIKAIHYSGRFRGKPIGERITFNPGSAVGKGEVFDQFVWNDEFKRGDRLQMSLEATRNDPKGPPLRSLVVWEIWHLDVFPEDRRWDGAIFGAWAGAMMSLWGLIVIRRRSFRLALDAAFDSVMLPETRDARE